MTSLFLFGSLASLALSLLAAFLHREAPIGPVLLLWGAAHVLYLVSAAIVLRRDPRFPLGAVIVVGLLPRLVLLPVEPALSEDVYRYLWDGSLVAEGVNPFDEPPARSPARTDREALLARLNHPEVRTIYPPAAQLLFGAAASLAPAPWAWKALLFALEAVLVAALVALLRARGRPDGRLLLYYWNPLVVVECHGNGHVDLAAAAFLLASLWLLTSGRRARGGFLLGLAALTKLVPLLLLPALLRRRAWRSLAVAAGTAAALYTPFAGAGGRVWEGLATYARHWDFNSAAYEALRPWFRDGDGPRLLLAGALALATLLIAARARTLTGAAYATLAAYVLLSPTVYPWYLVPLIALFPLHADPGFLIFSGSVALAYAPLAAYRASGTWDPPGWILGVEYGGLLVAWAAWAAWGARAHRKPAAGDRAGSGSAYARRAACTTDITPT